MIHSFMHSFIQEEEIAEVIDLLDMDNGDLLSQVQELDFLDKLQASNSEENPCSDKHQEIVNQGKDQAEDVMDTMEDEEKEEFRKCLLWNKEAVSRAAHTTGNEDMLGKLAGLRASTTVADGVLLLFFIDKEIHLSMRINACLVHVLIAIDSSCV